MLFKQSKQKKAPENGAFLSEAYNLKAVIVSSQSMHKLSGYE
jgi:hypothetical protein